MDNKKYLDIPNKSLGAIMSYVAIEENELIDLRNILANIYMDTPLENPVSKKAKEGLDITIKIMEEFYGQDSGTM